MRNRSGGAFALTAMLVFAALAPTGANAAERLYGVTDDDRLVTLHSDSPGVFRSAKPITGLLGSDTITAIDVRPSTGALYGLSSNSRLYTIAPGTGRATPVAGPFSPTRLGPQDAGFDFNPTVDKLRVVTGPGLNFRLDPITGQVVDGDAALTGVQADRNLSYEANDPAGSAKPRVAASAYSNNSAGAAGTRLFGIDTARDTLVLQNPPDAGVLNTVGKLRIDAGGPVGFDIAKGGRAYASFALRGRGPTGLFRVNLSNGRTTPAADFNAVGLFARTADDEVRALAAAGRMADDKSPPRVRNRKLNDPLVGQLLTGRVLRLQVRCSEACLAVAQLVLGRRVVGSATGGVLARGGRTVLRLRLTPKGRKIVRRVRPRQLDVGIAAADAAGNAVETDGFRR